MSKQYTIESWFIANGKVGQHLYSDKDDKSLTALASFHKKKISTERFVLVTTAKSTPIAKSLTKVTLL
jgi:hypothetical protein